MQFDFQCSDLDKLVFLHAPSHKIIKEIDLPKEIKILNPCSKRHSNYCDFKNQVHVNDLYISDFSSNIPYKLEESFDFVLKDYRWTLLSERSAINSNTFYLIKLKQLVFGCCKFIEQNNIKFMLAAGVPHSIETWVFTYLLENIYFGKVYIIDYSAVPGFVSIYYGLDRMEPLILNETFEPVSFSNDKKFNEYINLQKQDSKALDTRGRLAWLLDLDGFNGWYITKLRHLPQRLIQKMYSKYIFKKYLNVMNKEFPLPKKSVVYFMHVQPEATSLPVGLNHCEQFHAISCLRASFPSDYSIYVKEHPYMFKQPIDPRFRPPQYFELINSLEGVFLIDPYYPSYDLIDQSEFVATIIGKAGFQSLLREKPVVAFGLAPYREHKCCHHYQDQLQLKTFIKDVKDFDFPTENKKFIKLLKERTVSGHSEDSQNLDYGQARLAGMAKVVKKIFHIN